MAPPRLGMLRLLPEAHTRIDGQILFEGQDLAHLAERCRPATARRHTAVQSLTDWCASRMASDKLPEIRLVATPIPQEHDT